MNDPSAMTITGFQVLRTRQNGFSAEFTLTLSAITGQGETANARYSVTGYNQ